MLTGVAMGVVVGLKQGWGSMIDLLSFNVVFNQIYLVLVHHMLY